MLILTGNPFKRRSNNADNNRYIHLNVYNMSVEAGSFTDKIWILMSSYMSLIVEMN